MSSCFFKISLDPNYWLISSVIKEGSEMFSQRFALEWAKIQLAKAEKEV